jgi:hypothetical protein
VQDQDQELIHVLNSSFKSFIILHDFYLSRELRKHDQQVIYCFIKTLYEYIARYIKGNSCDKDNGYDNYNIRVKSQITNVEFMEVLDEICESTLPSREKLQYIFMRIPVSVYIAFGYLVTAERLSLRTLLQPTFTLSLDQCISIYKDLTSQTPWPVLPPEDEQESIRILNILFDPQNPLCAYQVALKLNSSNRTLDFIQMVRDKVASDALTDKQVTSEYSIIEGCNVLNKTFRKKFGVIAKSSLSPEQQMQIILREIYFSRYIAFGLLAQAERLLLYNLFVTYQTLGIHECTKIYPQIALPSDEFRQFSLSIQNCIYSPVSEEVSEQHQLQMPGPIARIHTRNLQMLEARVCAISLQRLEAPTHAIKLQMSEPISAQTQHDDI